MTEDGTTGGGQPPPAASTRGVRLEPAGSPRTTLTAQDVRRLTLFKWRYSLESVGFTPRQAGHLLFLKWLYARRRATGGLSG